jgi:hypothetical protein
MPRTSSQCSKNGSVRFKRRAARPSSPIIRFRYAWFTLTSSSHEKKSEQYRCIANGQTWFDADAERAGEELADDANDFAQLIRAIDEAPEAIAQRTGFFRLTTSTRASSGRCISAVRWRRSLDYSVSSTQSRPQSRFLHGGLGICKEIHAWQGRFEDHRLHPIPLAFVKSICDVMRRSNCASALQYVPELTWILFLRILDAQEARDQEQAEAVGANFAPRCARPTAGRIGPHRGPIKPGTRTAEGKPLRLEAPGIVRRR